MPLLATYRATGAFSLPSPTTPKPARRLPEESRGSRRQRSVAIAVQACQLLRRLRTDTRLSHAPTVYSYLSATYDLRLLDIDTTQAKPPWPTPTYLRLRLLDIDTPTDADCRLASW